MDYDSNAVMTAFSEGIEADSDVRGPRDLIAQPVQMRPVGAQAVSVKRDLPTIFRNLRKFAAAAGEAWYYSWDVKDKQSRRPDGKTTIEGPSVKLANDLARLYGNCSNGVERVEDVGSHWIFHARFVDYETGYEYNRPFQQRKNQGQGQGTQADRQADIAFQIGASKAVRNCVVNALGTFSDFAMAEAKSAIAGRVEKDIERYRVRVVNRLEELGVPLQRVERLIGKAHDIWDARQIAKLIAEIQSVGEGIAMPDEIWPDEKPDPKPTNKLESFADAKDAKADAPADVKAATPAVEEKPAAVQSKAVSPSPKGEAVAAAAGPVASEGAAGTATPAREMTSGAAILKEAAKPTSSDEAFPGDTPMAPAKGNARLTAEEIEQNRKDTIAARPSSQPRDAKGNPVTHDADTGEADIPAFLDRRAKPERGISNNPEDRQPPDDGDRVPDQPQNIPDHLNVTVVGQWFPDKPPQWISGYIARGQNVRDTDNPHKGGSDKIANAWRAGWMTRDAEDDVLPM